MMKYLEEEITGEGSGKNDMGEGISITWDVVGHQKASERKKISLKP